jgi:hypothetical protein
MIRGPSAGARLGTKVKVTVNKVEAARLLERLPARVAENVRRRAIRTATKPYIKTLATVWRTANYDGTGIHRRAIASAVKLDGPKRMGAGPGARLMFEIGVDYAAKRARHRQKIWHLLEGGFRHKASGKRVPGSYRSLRWARRSAQAMFEAVADQIIIEARKALS